MVASEEKLAKLKLMNTIALIDTRLKIPEKSIDTIVSTHETLQAAFKANEDAEFLSDEREQ